MRLQQQDTLRDLALSSMARLLEYLSASVARDAAARSTAVVDLGNSHTGSRRGAPLLAAELTLSADGGSLGYGIGPEAVHSRLMALFDNGLQRLQVGGAAGQVPAFAVTSLPSVKLPYLLPYADLPRRRASLPTPLLPHAPQGLPDLEPQLMEHLFWPDPRKLTSLHPREPEAVAARAVLEDLLARGLLPMRDYLACWKRWGCWSTRVFRVYLAHLAVDCSFALPLPGCSSSSSRSSSVSVHAGDQVRPR